MQLDKLLNIKIQPIFNSNGMEVNYGEVLIRALDSKTNIADVIKMCERTGRGFELDKFVLGKACEFIKETKGNNISLTVNICRKTLEKREVYKEIKEEIEKTGVCSSRILIEVNENTNYSNEVVVENINKLYECNIRTAIDDFICGGINVRAMCKSKFSMVKFDKANLACESVSEIKELNRIVKNMNKIDIETVIEGVETDEQLELARRVGYGYVQGFLLGRPMETKKYMKLYG